jgi:flagellar assembly factor FliW
VTLCLHQSAGFAIDTPHLGKITWDSCSELFLPVGLPGFENETRLIPVEVPAYRPLVFLQSAEHPGVCFVSLPVLTICPGFELHLTEDDRANLLLDAAAQPAIGADILCLAILLPSGGGAEANLGAPVVINLHNSRCIQSLSPQAVFGYYRLNDSGAWEAVC